MSIYEEKEQICVRKGKGKEERKGREERKRGKEEERKGREERKRGKEEERVCVVEGDFLNK